MSCTDWFFSLIFCEALHITRVMVRVSAPRTCSCYATRRQQEREKLQLGFISIRLPESVGHSELTDACCFTPARHGAVTQAAAHSPLFECGNAAPPCPVSVCPFMFSVVSHCLHHVDFLRIVQSWISTNGRHWHAKGRSGGLHQRDADEGTLWAEEIRYVPCEWWGTQWTRRKQFEQKLFSFFFFV